MLPSSEQLASSSMGFSFFFALATVTLMLPPESDELVTPFFDCEVVTAILSSLQLGSTGGVSGLILGQLAAVWMYDMWSGRLVYGNLHIKNISD